MLHDDDRWILAGFEIRMGAVLINTKVEHEYSVAPWCKR